MFDKIIAGIGVSAIVLIFGIAAVELTFDGRGLPWPVCAVVFAFGTYKVAVWCWRGILAELAAAKAEERA